MAIQALLTAIKLAEIHLSMKDPETENLTVSVGINALFTLGVTPDEMRTAIRELGW